MFKSSTRTIRSPLRFALACASLSTCSALALADPASTLFQPDVFGTETALHRRLASFDDPIGRECPISATPLSLSAAVDLALCRNPNTRVAWANARQQAAVLGSAESSWLPSISAVGSRTRATGDHLNSDNTYTTSADTSRDAALNLSWTLYDFGGREGRVSNARALLDAAAATTHSVIQQTVLATVQAFYGDKAASASLAAAGQTEADTARSFEIAKALHTGGVATLADVLQAETAYDQAVYARIQAEAAAKSAHGALAVTLGAPADLGLKIITDNVPDAPPALTARMADLMAEAQRQRPDLAAARAARDAAEADVTVARAAGRPSISVGMGRSITDTTGIPHQNYTTVGINVTVPIFSGFGTGYGVRQAQAALKAREIDVEAATLNVSLGVWNAYYGLEAANQELTTTAALLKTAQSNEDVALGRYQSGVASILDVLTAQSAVASARQLRINAEYGWQVARAQLALSLGRLNSIAPLASP